MALEFYIFWFTEYIKEICKAGGGGENPNLRVFTLFCVYPFFVCIQTRPTRQMWRHRTSISLKVLLLLKLFLGPLFLHTPPAPPPPPQHRIHTRSGEQPEQTADSSWHLFSLPEGYGLKSPRLVSYLMAFCYPDASPTPVERERCFLVVWYQLHLLSADEQTKRPGHGAKQISGPNGTSLVRFFIFSSIIFQLRRLCLNSISICMCVWRMFGKTCFTTIYIYRYI